MIHRRLIIFALYLTFVFCISMPVSAEVEGQPIATITKFTGEVLVRSKMEWVPVTTVNTLLYNGDKVVTKQGRAEIKFSADGTVVKVDLDSNIKITEEKEKTGAIVKRLVLARDVKVLLGKLWFNVIPTKDVKNNFTTPTMTAAIRGSEGHFDVGSKGETSARLDKGSWSTAGSFGEMPRSDPPNVDVPAKQLPSSDPAKSNLPIQQAAIKAADINKEAKGSENKAAELEKKAAEEKTVAVKVDASMEKVKASAKGAEANLNTVKECLEEAKVMKDTKAESEASKSIDNAQKYFTNISQIVKDAEQLAEKAKIVPAAMAEINAKAVEIISKTAETAKNATMVEAARADTHLTGRTEAIRQADTAAELARVQVDNANRTVTNTKEVVTAASAAVHENSLVVAMTTLTTVSNAAAIISNASGNAMTGAVAISSGDVSRANESLNVAARQNNVTINVIKEMVRATDSAVVAARTSDVMVINEAIRVSGNTVTATIKIGQESGVTLPPPPPAPVPEVLTYVPPERVIPPPVAAELITPPATAAIDTANVNIVASPSK